MCILLINSIQVNKIKNAAKVSLIRLTHLIQVLGGERSLGQQQEHAGQETIMKDEKETTWSPLSQKS